MMKGKSVLAAAAGSAILLFQVPTISFAQTEAAPPAVEEEAVQAPEPLTAEELEILVARIALYPDELVAVIAGASVYPLQLVEAQRFLEASKTSKDLKPDADWDGSVVSLLNYPQVVKMMSEDLDWTQTLGDAISYQESDVLDAIQQLREKAVAQGVIKTDDKVKVVEENDNIVIQPASTEVIYVPQYEPAMLYEPDYAWTPIRYYPDPYPHYYYPGAPYFAGFVTGAIWGGIVDWDDGFWGGRWGDDVDIDINCRKCFNDVDFDGKININKVDWKKVDRNKISIDKAEFNKIDKTKIKTDIKKSETNKLVNKSNNLKRTKNTVVSNKSTTKVKDVRSSTLEGLKSKKPSKPANVTRPSKPQVTTPVKRPEGGKIDRPVGKPKPAAKPDIRPKTPSPLGDIKRGRDAKNDSNRGAKSMGGGMKSRFDDAKPSGGGNKKIKRLPRGR